MTYIPRSTQLYAGKSLFISTGSYLTDNVGVGVAQLSRITDLSFAVAYDVVQQMYLNAASESWLNAESTVSASLRWFNTNGANEGYVGLATFTPSGQLTLGLDLEKSLYITVENQNGIDAIGASGIQQTHTVIGLAQGLLNQYTLSAAVGGLVVSEAHLSFLTSYVYSGQSGNQIPAVTYSNGSQVTGIFSLPAASSQYIANGPSGYLSTGATDYTSALSSNDLVMTFPVGVPYGVTMTGFSSCFLQSFSCTLGVDRQDMKPMGYVYPSARATVWPLHVDLSAEALVSSYQADALQRISCLGTGVGINVIVKQPCSNATLFGIYLTELQLVSQDFVASIGHSDVVSLHWRAILSNPSALLFDPTINFVVDSSGNAWGTHF